MSDGINLDGEVPEVDGYLSKEQWEALVRRMKWDAVEAEGLSELRAIGTNQPPEIRDPKS